jgi:hypothetical protein
MSCCRSDSEKETAKTAAPSTEERPKENAAAPAKTEPVEKQEQTKRRGCGCQC